MQNQWLTLVQGVVVVVALGTLNGSWRCIRWDNVLDTT